MVPEEPSETRKITSVNEFEKYLDDLYPYICECFHLPPEDAPKRPGLIVPGDKRGAEAMDDREGIHYRGGLSVIYVDKYRISEDPLPAQYAGEEIVHYLREAIGGRDSNLPVEDFVTYQSSFEFFGRLGSRLTADKSGESVEEVPSQESEFPNFPLIGWSEDTTMEEIRENLLGPTCLAYLGRGDNSVERKASQEAREIWEWMAHYAGYKATDENYPEVLNDEGLIYKSPGKIRREFGLSEKELEALERGCDLIV